MKDYRKDSLINHAMGGIEMEAQAIKLQWLAPVLDVRVRWNSTHKMIERALELWPALDRLLTFDSSRAFQRAQLTLDMSDWIVLEKLKDILQVFVMGTKFASASTYPTLTMQLPYYQFMQNKLHRLIQAERESSICEDSELDPRASTLLWAAADEAYKKLNLYWQKTDDHSGQAVATMLDPRMWLKVFENLRWEPEWVSNVKEKFNRVYNEYYASKERDLDTGGVVEISESHSALTASGVWLQVGAQRPGTSSSSLAHEVGFDDLVFGPPDTPSQESQQGLPVDFYLAEECADRRADPVQWWKLHAHQFPSLALMAHDYLSVPATRYAIQSNRLHALLLTIVDSDIKCAIGAGFFSCR